MTGKGTPGPRPEPSPEPVAPEPNGFVARWWPRRRTWLMLGRVLGGFGAFIAAVVAATQFAFGGGGAGSTESTATNEIGGASTPYSYAERSDDTGTIRVEVPTAWGIFNGAAWRANHIGDLIDGTMVGSKLVASPNLAAWRAAGELATPGIFVGTSRLLAAQWTPRGFVGLFSYEGCQFESDGPYRGARLTGWVTRSACPGTTTRWTTLAATHAGLPGVLVFVQAKLVSDDDQEAFERALATLELGSV